MNKTSVVHARVEPRTKKKAEGVLKKLGMSPTEAIRLFYRQICLRSGIPFSILILPTDSVEDPDFTMKYHRRLIETKIQAFTKAFACTLVTGARQVGKNTLLNKLFGKNYKTFVFDPVLDRLQISANCVEIKPHPSSVLHSKFTDFFNNRIFHLLASV